MSPPVSHQNNRTSAISRLRTSYCVGAIFSMYSTNDVRRMTDREKVMRLYNLYSAPCIRSISPEERTYRTVMVLSLMKHLSQLQIFCLFVCFLKKVVLCIFVAWISSFCILFLNKFLVLNFMVSLWRTCTRFIYA